MDREFVAKLVAEIENIKRRVAEQTAVAGNAAGRDLSERQAVFRNLAMQLTALELMLRKIDEQAYGG
jgi:capsule polysaccharide export protein KpsE/RkpR